VRRTESRIAGSHNNDIVAPHITSRSEHTITEEAGARSFFVALAGLCHPRLRIRADDLFVAILGTLLRAKKSIFAIRN